MTDTTLPAEDIPPEVWDTIDRIRQLVDAILGPGGQPPAAGHTAGAAPTDQLVVELRSGDAWVLAEATEIADGRPAPRVTVTEEELRQAQATLEWSVAEGAETGRDVSKALVAQGLVIMARSLLDRLGS
jgi:hypothetical protein